MRETFMQLCIYFTLCLLAVTLCINFVSAAEIYGVAGSAEQNPNIEYPDDDGKGLNVLSSVSDTDTTNLWAIAVSGIGVITIIIGILTGGNTQIIAGWIFSAVFWTSWLSLMTVTEIGAFIPQGIIWIATALMVPIFVGALIGIFSGSG